MSEILFIADMLEGKLKPASMSLAGFALDLAESTGDSVTAILLGSAVEKPAREFSENTGINVLGLEHPNLDLYNAEAYKSVLVPLLKEREPGMVLLPHSSFGWDLAPRLAVALNWSSLSGVSDFSMDEGLSFVRAVLGGKLHRKVRPVAGKPAIITIISSRRLETVAKKSGEVKIRSCEADTGSTRALGLVPAPERGINLNQAEVIVAVGRGIGGPDGLDIIRELTGCFDKGMIGASRPVVDYGWLPLEHQVGQTGQTVSPKLYISCGISGQIQHTIGMSDSACIVAINTDPGALIFNTAHYGVTLDLQQFLPILIEKLRESR